MTWSGWAETSAAPINVKRVQIAMSTDGGQTFVTLADATGAMTFPNNGTASVVVPDAVDLTARAVLRIEAVQSLFFDLSARFTIDSACANGAPDGTPCKDADLCMLATECQGGACVPDTITVAGTSVSLPPQLPDGRACTVDTCRRSLCVGADESRCGATCCGSGEQCLGSGLCGACKTPGDTSCCGDGICVAAAIDVLDACTADSDCASLDCDEATGHCRVPSMVIDHVDALRLVPLSGDAAAITADPESSENGGALLLYRFLADANGAHRFDALRFDGTRWIHAGTIRPDVVDFAVSSRRATAVIVWTEPVIGSCGTKVLALRYVQGGPQGTVVELANDAPGGTQHVRTGLSTAVLYDDEPPADEKGPGEWARGETIAAWEEYDCTEPANPRQAMWARAATTGTGAGIFTWTAPQAFPAAAASGNPHVVSGLLDWPYAGVVGTGFATPTYRTRGASVVWTDGATFSNLRVGRFQTTGTDAGGESTGRTLQGGGFPIGSGTNGASDPRLLVAESGGGVLQVAWVGSDARLWARTFTRSANFPNGTWFPDLSSLPQWVSSPPLANGPIDALGLAASGFYGNSKLLFSLRNGDTSGSIYATDYSPDRPNNGWGVPKPIWPYGKTFLTPSIEAENGIFDIGYAFTAAPPVAGANGTQGGSGVVYASATRYGQPIARTVNDGAGRRGLQLVMSGCDGIAAWLEGPGDVNDGTLRMARFASRRAPAECPCMSRRTLAQVASQNACYACKNGACGANVTGLDFIPNDLSCTLKFRVDESGSVPVCSIGTAAKTSCAAVLDTLPDWLPSRALSAEEATACKAMLSACP